MANKENIPVASVPVCSLITHVGKREGFLFNGNSMAGPLGSCKGTRITNRFKTNRDVNRIPKS